jgi:hypothetical protein
MYRVSKQTGEGEFTHVTTRQLLEQAVQVVEDFNVQWPGRYVVRDVEGNDVHCTEVGTIQPGTRRSSRPTKRG